MPVWSVDKEYHFAAGLGRFNDIIRPKYMKTQLEDWVAKAFEKESKYEDEADFAAACKARLWEMLDFLKTASSEEGYAMPAEIALKLWGIAGHEVKIACVNAQDDVLLAWVNDLDAQRAAANEEKWSATRVQGILTGGPPPSLKKIEIPFEGYLGPELWWTAYKGIINEFKKKGTIEYPTREMIVEYWEPTIEPRKEAARKKLEDEARKQAEERDAKLAMLAESRARAAALEAELGVESATESVSVADPRSAQASRGPRTAGGKGKGKAKEKAADDDDFNPSNNDDSDAPKPAATRKNVRAKPAGKTKAAEPKAAESETADDPAAPKKFNHWAMPRLLGATVMDFNKTPDEIMATAKENGHIELGALFSLIAMHGIDWDPSVLYMKTTCQRCVKNKTPCIFRGIQSGKSATCLCCFLFKQSCVGVVLPDLPEGEHHRDYVPSFELRGETVKKFVKAKLFKLEELKDMVNVDTWYSIGGPGYPDGSKPDPTTKSKSRSKSQKPRARKARSVAPPHQPVDTEASGAMQDTDDPDVHMSPPHQADDLMDVDSAPAALAGPATSQKRGRTSSVAETGPTSPGRPRKRFNNAMGPPEGFPDHGGVSTTASEADHEPERTADRGVVYPNPKPNTLDERTRTVQPAASGEFGTRPPLPAISAISSPRTDINADLLKQLEDKQREIDDLTRLGMSHLEAERGYKREIRELKMQRSDTDDLRLKVNEIYGTVRTIMQVLGAVSPERLRVAIEDTQADFNTHAPNLPPIVPPSLLGIPVQSSSVSASSRLAKDLFLNFQTESEPPRPPLPPPSQPEARRAAVVAQMKSQGLAVRDPQPAQPTPRSATPRSATPQAAPAAPQSVEGPRIASPSC
ncbi:hypothetical protein PENSPDRAFT_695236 [Peniophora sp. CONT]|nr:hypothetical protein PENSPDRAFT_695236 [Peniophora sp. CONT]